MIEIAGIEIASQAIVSGLVSGLIYAAFAAGFVLIYRSTGVLNFAQGEQGAFGLALFVLLNANYDVPWWAAFVLAVVGSAVVGALIELLVVRRLFSSPRLVLLIATIGVGQILLLARVAWIPDINDFNAIPTAVSFVWEPTNSLRIDARQTSVIFIVPLLVVALGAFLTRTRFGLAIRASASNADTARVYGTSPRRVSTIVWATGGAFAAATAILIGPFSFSQAGFVDDTGAALTADLLVPALLVSMLARRRSLPAAVWAGMAVGVVERLIATNFDDRTLPDLMMFIATVLVVLFLSRERREDGNWSLSPQSRPVPERLASIWWVRNLNRIGFVFLFAALAAIPIFVTSFSGLFLWSRVLVWAIVAVSLTILTGWSGQISLGQFAFVGVGGMATIALTNGHDLPIPLDLFDASPTLAWLPAVVMATLFGVVIALLVGLPALRVRGLFLAVVTLAFAVMCVTWLFEQDAFTGGSTIPANAQPPVWFGFDFGEGQRGKYYLSLASLMVVAWIAARIRASGLGRSLIAVRDNPEMASASTVGPARTKLIAFAISGGVAAYAGGLLVLIEPSVNPGVTFAPGQSIQAIVMAIIGGLGSVAGPILGSLWVLGIRELVPDELRDLQQLLTSDIGLLILLMYLPGGLLQIVYVIRDRVLDFAESRLPEADGPPVVPAVAKAPPSRSERAAAVTTGPALETEEISVSFGGNVAVDRVSFRVEPGELVGLIGTNGAGKSTLLNAISGFVPSTGAVRVQGVDVANMPAAARHRVGLGRGFQAARLYPDLSVRETLQVALEARHRSPVVASMLGVPPSLAGERRKRAEADEIIDYLGLGRYADEPTGHLSTGTRRIVELGGLLAVDARVLLLDEPTGGVAQRETEAFGPLIRRIQRELDAAVVVIEHDMPLVMSISDRVYCLESGIVIAEGAPDEVRENEAVIASYLGTDERAIQRSDS